ncbi:uncharacterized protein LOC130718569 isoform X2 [Lotus japonicus]|uniref:uncharacterized protein LOC130718569 isoform X2 n=1 Tax=Lotus japonicus TaxID=34305 RepID=UPI002585CD4F|nr:uncharacterized protein LOC130718569 isoform X2 [Lotus japonicus]
MEDDAAASNKCDSSSCCPICLGPFLQLSYLDKCFHEFCFNCILRWSKVAAGKHHSPPSSVKCPLCFLDDLFNISQYWKSSKYYHPNCWLESWLRREIQALIQEEDVDIIVHHILGVVKSFSTRREQRHINDPEKKQEEFKMSVSEAARPFLAARTERFVYEIQLFLASGLNIEAYDAVYIQRLGWSSPGVNTEVDQSELIDRTTVIPYLYIFDYDSDGNE